jgi:hypothetical protein
LVRRAPAQEAASIEAGEHDRHRLARKIDPRYAEGQPVRLVGARNQVEADFIQSLLLEQGIPSMQQRARGFDVPEFLAAGPRDVLVPASALQAAQETLMQSDLLSAGRQSAPVAVPWRVMALLLAALAVVAVVIAIAARL